MINNIKLEPESFFSKMQNNIIMIKSELKDMQNKEVVSLDSKKRFNQFVQ